MEELMISEYEGIEISFGDEGWFNATEVGVHFGKRVDHWLANEDTREYIAELCKITSENQQLVNTRNSGYLQVPEITSKFFIKTKRGKHGGTWLHPRLAVLFARWCSPRFGIWCDIQIEKILRNKHPRQEWWRLRHQAASSYKVLCDTIKFAKEADGKEPKFYDYSNEARMINQIMFGCDKQDRHGLDKETLDILAKIEEHDLVLVGARVPYQQRKELITSMYEALVRAGARQVEQK